MNDAIRFAEQEEASQARVSLHERDEDYLRGKQAIQGKETVIHEESKVEKMKYNLTVEESFVSQWRMETRSLKMRTSRVQDELDSAEHLAAG